MGKRGSVEEVTTRIASTLKSSELLTDAGVHHAIVVLHPTEGLIFCGEEKFTQTIQDLVEVNGVDKLMKKAVMNSGSRPNFRSSRKEKEELLLKMPQAKGGLFLYSKLPTIYTRK